MTPKVFVSHAGEDREFTQDLATKLRASGVNAWLDVWEILPGDSLIDKIFEEGLKDAKGVIVILSRASVDKKWVREELNAAMVKKINGLTKLIPVVLDDCEIPEALHSTVWIRINDPRNYEKELDQIIRAIFELRDKPEIGAPPAYATSRPAVIPGLSTVDSLVLQLVGDQAVKKGTGRVGDDRFFAQTRTHDVSDEIAFESLQMLESVGYVEIKRVHNTSRFFHSTKLSPPGLEQYATNYVSGYEALPKQVANQIVNVKQVDTTEIAKALDQPILVINHIVESFQQQQMFKVIVSRTADYNLHIFQISPILKRVLD